MPRNFKADRDDDDRGVGVRGPAHGRGRCVVPELTPVRPGRHARHRLRRLMYGRRRMTAAGLAVAAAAMAASAPRGERDLTSSPEPRAHPGRPSTAPAPDAHGRSPGSTDTSLPVVSAPVRIADAATVRLLRPGDRIDVIAATDQTGPARVVARGVRVARVPEMPKSADNGSGDGALVVLRVPRRTATVLAGAATTTRLAVTLC